MCTALSSIRSARIALAHARGNTLIIIVVRRIILLFFARKLQTILILGTDCEEIYTGQCAVYLIANIV